MATIHNYITKASRFTNDAGMSHDLLPFYLCISRLTNLQPAWRNPFVFSKMSSRWSLLTLTPPQTQHLGLRQRSSLLWVCVEFFSSQCISFLCYQSLIFSRGTALTHSQGRRYLRFFKYFDAFTLASNSFNRSMGVLATLEVGKWSCLGMYLLLESFTIVSLVSMRLSRFSSHFLRLINISRWMQWRFGRQNGHQLCL